VTPLPDPVAGGDAHGAPREEGRSGSTGLTVFLVVAPILVVAIGILVWVVAAGDDARASETIEIVVPAGTQGRLDAGETVVVMPTRLEFRVGDRIVIRNEDDVAQSVGPYEVDAGEEMLLQYGAPGVYEGYCPLSEGERYEIVVTA
jgi:hypothetical protein